ncbi:pyroglutamyl-peptidase I [Falsarthrobacter nasiphocae]|uniref:Pyrrolidone-carboxylate peptidase n=1 Tax=Falsarthrobacter nasiphocae TaxID=189863 RepID=A0AAE4C779_9MICC|nr:pyroglutamyl-peptidase I [Falsarthrobacter nasiphocae]MDR6892269.1 pyroglutamyl-peptidase I [Falsarthrobacter nasiphocae]
MRILVTGFEPFGGDQENASGQAVAELSRLLTAEPLTVDGEEPYVAIEILPVTFAGSGRVLAELVDRHEPDVILSIGEAGGRAAITPERNARNLDNARIPDNEGAQPVNEPIDPNGTDLESLVDVEALVEAIRAVDLPAEASDDAGLFVCNHVFYEGVRLAQSRGARAGFIHVPAVRSQGEATVGAETDGALADRVSAPSLTFADLGRGLRAAVESVAGAARA